MISDILSDAIYEINQYQKEMPDIYDSHKNRIETVKSVMKKLRIFFDTPPKENKTK